MLSNNISNGNGNDLDAEGESPASSLTITSTHITDSTSQSQQKQPLSAKDELKKAILMSFSCGENRPMRGADDCGEGGWVEEEDDEDDAELIWDWDAESGPVGKAGNLTSASVMKSLMNATSAQQAAGGAKQEGGGLNAQYVPKSDALLHMDRKVYLGDIDRAAENNTMKNNIKTIEQKVAKQGEKSVDRANRATTEQVLDPRTRLMLFKMLSSGLISEINGCVSTGKEANVYHALSPEHGSCAIKVYKTSILVFKDRDRYVNGEFRFRHGYAKSNPRKMVKMWAEKEMRNLKRLEAANIPCPKALHLRNHVLLMTFIGEDGWAAPRLKDAKLSLNRARECYLQCIKIMRSLFHVCHLVHADLSEYNMLYFNKQLYIIDVSQSVEHEHPQASEFLMMDCANVSRFFRNLGVAVMNDRELFEFITHPSLEGEGQIDSYLDEIKQGIKDREGQEITPQAEIDAAVFQATYVPRTLDEIKDITREFNKAMDPSNQSGLANALRKMALHPESHQQEEEKKGKKSRRKRDVEKEQKKSGVSAAAHSSTSAAIIEEEEEEDVSSASATVHMPSSSPSSASSSSRVDTDTVYDNIPGVWTSIKSKTKPLKENKKKNVKDKLASQSIPIPTTTTATTATTTSALSATTETPITATTATTNQVTSTTATATTQTAKTTTVTKAQTTSTTTTTTTAPTPTAASPSSLLSSSTNSTRVSPPSSASAVSALSSKLNDKEYSDMDEDNEGDEEEEEVLCSCAPAEVVEGQEALNPSEICPLCSLPTGWTDRQTLSKEEQRALRRQAKKLTKEETRQKRTEKIKKKHKKLKIKRAQAKKA